MYYGGKRIFLPLRASGLVSSVTYLRGTPAPLCILDFVELRLPPLISHEETAPSRQSRQKKPLTPNYY